MTPAKRPRGRPRKISTEKKEPPKKKVERGGRYEFEPTPEIRKTVHRLAGVGLTHREIAAVVENPKTGRPISVQTLETHFKKELEGAVSSYKGAVYASLFKKAIGDGPQSVTAAIWITKCRFGWKGADRVIHEIGDNSGVLIAPASKTPEEWIAEQKIKNNNRNSPIG